MTSIPVMVCLLRSRQGVAGTFSLYLHRLAFSTSKIAVDFAGTAGALEPAAHCSACGTGPVVGAIFAVSRLGTPPGTAPLGNG